MKKNKKYKHIIFDFDGVLAESNDIRVAGFGELFKEYPADRVERLLEYARINGGISRYAKIKYFFESIMGQAVTDAQVRDLAKRYSGIVKKKVIAAPPVAGAVEFLRSYGNICDFAIVSGSDEEELTDVCRHRGIAGYFVEILGSPRDKHENVAALLAKRGWEKGATVFVGDSVNDYEAARANGIDFIVRNAEQPSWAAAAVPRIRDLTTLHTLL